MPSSTKLTPRQRQALDFLREHLWSTRAAVAEGLATTERAAGGLLSRLLWAGLVKCRKAADRELLDYLGGQILQPALIEANAMPEGIPSTRWWLRPLPIRDPNPGHL